MNPTRICYADVDTIVNENTVARIGRFRLGAPAIGGPEIEIYRTHWYYEQGWEEARRQLRMALDCFSGREPWSVT